MSEYRRFISYVYEYENEKKSANRGFVKVECRSGTCKMDFCLRGLCRDANGVLDIYAFQREGSALLGSLLDRSQIRNGILNLQLQFPENDIGASHYSIYHLAGILLLCNKTCLYATQWDDGPLNLQSFSVDSMKSESSTEKEETFSFPSDKENFDKKNSNEENSDEEKTAPAADLPQEPSKGNPNPKTSNPEIPNPAEKKPCTEKEGDQMHATSTEPLPSNSFSMKNGCLCDCKRICPSDLNKLPPRDRHLAGNRFVLYGYQMFGHLLIGKLCENNQTVLCVPGNYRQQDRLTANMFGFNHFLPCPVENSSSRFFGYWYLPVSPS